MGLFYSRPQPQPRGSLVEDAEVEHLYQDGWYPAMPNFPPPRESQRFLTTNCECVYFKNSQRLLCDYLFSFRLSLPQVTGLAEGMRRQGLLREAGSHCPHLCSQEGMRGLRLLPGSSRDTVYRTHRLTSFTAAFQKVWDPQQ